MRRGLFILGSVLAAAGAAGAQTPGLWFTGLAPNATNGWATALNQDGSVAAGYCFGISSSSPYYAPGFTWTQAGGRYDFGNEPGLPPTTSAFGIDSGGGTVVGHVLGETVPQRAFRRVGSGPLENLGVLAGNTRSYARGVSGDGQTVVGACEYSPWNETYGEAFRWTSTGGMQGLGYTRPGSFFSQARGVSRDGGTIIGQSHTPDFIFDAFVWRQGTGMQILPGLPGPVLQADATAVNANGTVVVGLSITNTPQQYSHAVKWSGGVVTDLGSLPGLPSTAAYALNDTGDVIGGGAYGITSAPFVWTPSSGMQLLSDYLSARGITVPSGYELQEINAISGDGLTFAGKARNLVTGAPEGFIVTVPSQASALVIVVAALGRRRRRAI